ncbi:MAG: hypothetical protein SOV63_00860 [Pyramidobacter porci]|uniref:hypothetical protein n=1 Tax=Pyramidobacter porci TaxID=2605789 RepID=UPI002A762875|nr:hypothetical protein [Pyramidobacter porci]MCI6261315.1 hypothetical protein [Pyramidobacter sp.]MDY2647336.1 hypothetical protein [Pyramidobacter porci]
MSPHITLSPFKILENTPCAFRRAPRRRQFTTIIRVCPQAQRFSLHPAETARLFRVYVRAGKDVARRLPGRRGASMTRHREDYDYVTRLYLPVRGCAI